MKHQIIFFFSLFSTLFAMGESNILHVCYHTNGILSKATVGEKPGARTEIHWDSTGQMISYAEIVGSNHYGNDHRIWMLWHPNGVKAEELLPGADGLPITRSWYSNGQMEKEEVARPEGFATLRTWTAEGAIVIDGTVKNGSPWEGMFVHNYAPFSGSNAQISVSYQRGLLYGIKLESGCVWVREWHFMGTNDQMYQVNGAFFGYIANSNDCAVQIIGNMVPKSAAVNPLSLKTLDELQFHELPLKDISTNDLNYLSLNFNYKPLRKFFKKPDFEEARQ
jgi:hypothetical protein